MTRLGHRRSQVVGANAISRREGPCVGGGSGRVLQLADGEAMAADTDHTENLGFPDCSFSLSPLVNPASSATAARSARTPASSTWTCATRCRRRRCRRPHPQQQRVAGTGAGTGRTGLTHPRPSSRLGRGPNCHERSLAAAVSISGELLPFRALYWLGCNRIGGRALPRRMQSLRSPYSPWSLGVTCTRRRHGRSVQPQRRVK